MGEVQVFDAHHLVPVVTIPAHDNPIVAMNFNRTGDKLATASDKGTVIRIFSMPEGNKVTNCQRLISGSCCLKSLCSSDSQEKQSIFMSFGSGYNCLVNLMIEHIRDLFFL